MPPKKYSPKSEEKKRLRHPLIPQIAELAAQTAGVRLTVVYPTADGWGEERGDTRADLQPDFCRLFQAAPDGARHCRLCHVLMTAAACGGGPAVQRCHAGASVLVCPAVRPGSDSEAIAVVSSCMFATAEAWKETAARGKLLGLDSVKLRRAFQALPALSEPQRQRLQSIMRTMALAVQTVRHCDDLTQRLREQVLPAAPTADLDAFLKKTDWAKHARPATKSRRARMPLLVRAICEMARQRPDLPLTVKELATAARMTPNHLTALFHQWTGQSFTDYLWDQRMARARELLGNATLNINEIAQMTGYDDPGYFARRFRKATGLSPRQWRERTPSRRKRRPAPH